MSPTEGMPASAPSLPLPTQRCIDEQTLGA
jgi:hypothetical protein